MPGWTEIRTELAQTLQPNGQPDFDAVRRRWIRQVSEHTGRPLLIYATDFFNERKAAFSGGDVNLDFRDKDGFLECTRTLDPPNLDILIHSPGGLAEAAESIVKLLRKRFTNIRFIVPSIAKSAATMLVLSGDQILMDEMSELGPIDPQFRITRADGTTVMAPAQAIIDQFEAAEKSLAGDAKLLPAWIPILPQYGPSLYQQCKNAIQLSKRLVREWLSQYMFKAQTRAKANGTSRRISNFFGDHNNFLTHARRVDVPTMQRLGINVMDMNVEAELQRRINRLYHAIMITFDGTAAYKLMENSSNDAYIKLINVQAIQQIVALPQQLAPQQPAGAAAGGN